MIQTRITRSNKLPRLQTLQLRDYHTSQSQPILVPFLFWCFARQRVIRSETLLPCPVHYLFSKSVSLAMRWHVCLGNSQKRNNMANWMRKCVLYLRGCSRVLLEITIVIFVSSFSHIPFFSNNLISAHFLWAHPFLYWATEIKEFGIHSPNLNSKTKKGYFLSPFF